MATPRVTIDQLPEQAAAEDTNYVIVQDDGITKKMSMATLRNMPSNPLTAHINATVDAHDATAISAVASGVGVDSATVQGQLSQLAALTDAAVTQAEGDARYVNLTGDTMTGPLYASGAPVIDLEVATKKYVDDSIASSSEGITQAEADGWYVNVTGDVVTGPLSVEGGLAAGSMPITNVGQAVAATDALPKGQADGIYVAKTGDTMTGKLTITSLVEGLSIRSLGAGLALTKDSDEQPYMELRHSSGAPVFGELRGQSTQTRLQAKLGDIHLQSLAGAALLTGKTDLKLSVEDAPGRAVNGWFGFRNSIILPRSYDDPADLEGLLVGKGFRFEIGNQSGTMFHIQNTGFDKHIFRNDGFTRHAGAVYLDNGLRVFSASSGQVGILSGTGDNCYQAFYGNATSNDAIGTRSGYIGYPGNSTMYIKNELASGAILLQAGGVIDLYTGNVFQGRMDSAGNLLWGKGTAAVTTQGCALESSGRIHGVVPSAASVTYVSNILGAVAGNAHFHFRRDNATVGSIVMNGTTGVTYNQTSDKRLKTKTREVDDDEALAKMEQIEPVHFTWNSDPDAGEKIGFFAQDLQLIVPDAVTEGTGEPGDEEFVPWGMDNSMLVPYLVAAVQAMARKLVALRTELDELRASVGNP